VCDYRTQDIALLVGAVAPPGIVLALVLVLKGVVAAPLPIVVVGTVVGPRLQVGQLCAFDEPVEKGNDLA